MPSFVTVDGVEYTPASTAYGGSCALDLNYGADRAMTRSRARLAPVVTWHTPSPGPPAPPQDSEGFLTPRDGVLARWNPAAASKSRIRHAQCTPR
ncbi:MAG: hypothetical protein IPJ24_15870 [bacterium]|nr:hypothetical protein [bacterium]